jgi:hypothetical protein
VGGDKKWVTTAIVTLWFMIQKGSLNKLLDLTTECIGLRDQGVFGKNFTALNIFFYCHE